MAVSCCILSGFQPKLPTGPILCGQVLENLPLADEFSLNMVVLRCQDHQETVDTKLSLMHLAGRPMQPMQPMQPTVHEHV